MAGKWRQITSISLFVKAENAIIYNVKLYFAHHFWRQKMSMAKNRKFRRITAFLIAATLLSLSFTIAAYAAETPWRSAAPEIYQDNGIGSTVQSSKNKVMSTLGDFVGDLANGVLGSILNPFIQAVANIFNALLLTAGISLDSIVFGRVGNMASLTNGVSLFQFDLTRGNIYGIVTMFLYNGLLFFFVIYFCVMVLIKLTRLLWVSNDARTRLDAKNTFYTCLGEGVAIYAAPKLLDLVLWVKDLTLYGVMYLVGSFTNAVRGNITGYGIANVIGTVVDATLHPAAIGASVIAAILGPGGQYSFTEMYRVAAQNGDIFANLMYLSSTILTLFFAISYVTAAFSLGILLIFFPFCCVLDVQEGGYKRIKDWATAMLGIVIIPVIDAVLLLFPIAIGLLGNGTAGAYSLIQFVMLATVIPARSFLRQKLGLAEGGRMEMAGIGALLAVGRLGKGLVDTVKGVSTGKAALDTLASNKRAEAQLGKTTGAGNDAVGKESASVFEQKVQALYKNEAMQGVEGYGGYSASDVEASFQGAGLNSVQKNAARAESIKANISQATNARLDVERKRASEADTYAGEVATLKEKKQANIDKIAELKSSNAMASRSLAQEKPGTAGYAGIQNGIADNNTEIARLDRENKQIDKDISSRQAEAKKTDDMFRDQISGLSSVERSGREALQSLKPVGGEADLNKLAAAESAVTLENYDDPEMKKAISPEKYGEMAEQHAQYLENDAKKVVEHEGTRAAFGGIVGAAAGAPFGLAGGAAGAGLGMQIATSRSEGKIAAGFQRAVQNTGHGTELKPVSLDAYRDTSSAAGIGSVASQATPYVHNADAGNYAPNDTPTEVGGYTGTTIHETQNFSPRAYDSDGEHFNAASFMKTFSEDHPYQAMELNRQCFAYAKGFIDEERREELVGNGNTPMDLDTANKHYADIASTHHSEKWARMFVSEGYANQYQFSNRGEAMDTLRAYLKENTEKHYLKYVSGAPGKATSFARDITGQMPA